MDSVTKPVDQVLSGVSSAAGKLTNSVMDWIHEVTGTLTGLTEPAPYYFTSALLVMLVIHFVLYALENNTGIQKSKSVHQSLYETRVFLQTAVVKHYLYWGFFILGAMTAVSIDVNSYESFFMYFRGYGSLVLLTLLVNKVCLVLTQVYNPEYSGSVAGTPYPPFGPGGVGEVSPINTNTHGIPLLSATKFKAGFVVVRWVQTVTDILLQQFPSLFFGFATTFALKLVR